MAENSCDTVGQCSPNRRFLCKCPPWSILDQGQMRLAGRVATTAEELQDFAQTLSKEDAVVLEATCNIEGIVRLLQAHASRVAISNPRRTRAIAEAKIKTDKVDAQVLAQLLASDFLPEVWLPNEQSCPVTDLFGRAGRTWLAQQVLPADEHATIVSLLHAIDQAGKDVAAIDRVLAQEALRSAEAWRLMTIPGIDATVALGLVAAIGDIDRFASSQKLVSYLGLNPSVRQSGLQPAHYGRITKQGRAHARGLLVERRESAWAVAGLLRPDPSAPRATSGFSRHGSEAGRACLAAPAPSPGLHLGTAGASGPQAADARTTSGSPGP